MKSRQYAGILSFLAIFAVGCSAELDTTDAALLGQTDDALTGNGAPSGAHYQLNIIGVPQDKQADMKGNNGGRIFVPLWGKTEIWLTEGTNFRVCDANGTDADGAEFEMPSQVAADYDVYVRALGTPGGSADVTTCATDMVTGELVCSMNTVSVDRNKGRSTFNVARDLLQICPPDSRTCVDLFGDGYEDYYWNYDNQGLKVAQLRFYEKN